MFQPDLLHIISFKLLKFNITEIKEFKDDLQYFYQIDNNIHLSFNKEKKFIKSKLTLNAELMSEDDEILYSKGDFIIEIVFFVENFDELSEFNEEKILVIDKNLGDNVIAISYSTTRGYLIEKVRDTSFDDFILPIIDIRKDINTNSQ